MNPLVYQRLIAAGTVDREQLEAHVSQVAASRLPAWISLIQAGIVTAAEMARAAAVESRLSLIDLDEHELDVRLFELVRAEYAWTHHVIPVNLPADDRLIVAIADPYDVGALDQIQRDCGKTVRGFVASLDQIHRVLGEQYPLGQMSTYHHICSGHRIE